MLAADLWPAGVFWFQYLVVTAVLEHGSSKKSNKYFTTNVTFKVPPTQFKYIPVSKTTMNDLPINPLVQSTNYCPDWSFLCLCHSPKLHYWGMEAREGKSNTTCTFHWSKWKSVKEHLWKNVSTTWRNVTNSFLHKWKFCRQVHYQCHLPG